ncbi:hypothetical protein [Streptomyces silvensis]|uniref:Uncharacterized protein n=1 Tax=Streptomyces silvensis TaxID=1765722 RepID=A0A0W7WX89_9ACTN|nr:hypothetical protein [Streptomyces silvensis]KUF15190.1 hypothetical protein AT728_26600 [Streptomyces silvensis]
MGSLFEELEAREAAARGQVEELEVELADLAGRLDQARELLERLRIARETVADVMAEMSADAADVPEAEPETSAAGDGDEAASPYAGAQRRVVGVLTVPKWQPRMGVDVLPRVYRDIMEVIADAPGPVRAKQIVPRIGLPVEVGKIETTRVKLKRLVTRGWLDEDDPGLFTVARARTDTSPNSS